VSRGHNITRCRYCVKEYVVGDCITSDCELGRGAEKLKCPGYAKYLESQDRLLMIRRDRTFQKLLSGTAALKNPDFHTMSDDERLLHLVLLTYVKHHLNIDIIGWDALADLLHCQICNMIGDDEFIAWGERIKAEGDK
jgi:hypothetical protein